MPIADGFAGQRLVVMPPAQTARLLRREPWAQLLPTDAGRFPQAAGHERHRPSGCPQAILIACESGCGWIQLAGRRLAVPARHAALLPPGVPHAYGADPLTPWTIRWVHLAGRQVEPLIALAGGPVLAPSEPARLAALLDLVHDRMLTGDDRALLAAAGAAWQAMTLVVAMQTAPGPVEAAMAFFEDRIDRELDIAAAARLCGLSRSQFDARFRAATGLSALAWCTARRMALAEELLAATQLPVTVVAARCGYADPFYFSRRFRALHGVTPTRWRQDGGRTP